MNMNMAKYHAPIVRHDVSFHRKEMDIMERKIEYTLAEGDRLRVFATNARCLSREEVSGLPLDARSSAEAAGLEGTWLEVLCPEEACITGKDTITLSVRGVEGSGAGAGGRKDEGLWMRLFCPDKACVITSPSGLP